MADMRLQIHAEAEAGQQMHKKVKFFEKVRLFVSRAALGEVVMSLAGS